MVGLVMDCPIDSGALSDSESTDEEYEILPIDINLSEIATQKLLELVDNETGDMVLKIAVHRGGCSGNLYDLELVDRPEGGGFQFDEVNGIHIAVSDYDSSLLSGIVIDFQDSLMGGGFKINNPNAQKECGCGKSFA